MTVTPRRALIVSANIGEGHNAAGRALEHAIARQWPGCRVRWLDTLAVLGAAVGPAARACYVSQIQHTPRMYEFFFSGMWRHRWYLNAARRGIGAWCGRRLAPHVQVLSPDVVVSTYPMGSAGLSWLRRHGQLPMPAGAWVPAFCPHPFWLYGNLDITFVMHPRAAAMASRAEPGIRVAVGALPVVDAFAPASRAASRTRLGVAPGRFTVVLCAGSFALGGVDRAVSALLAAGADMQVIVVCGRNERLRRRLCARGEPASRLLVLGWTDDMPGVMAASDVVVSNAGGATGLEAVASARPVIMCEPIAGHGQANADLMASSGLAQLASSPAQLTMLIRRAAHHSTELAMHARGIQAKAAARAIEDDLACLAAADRADTAAG